MNIASRLSRIENVEGRRHHNGIDGRGRVLATVKVSIHRCLVKDRTAPVIAFSFFDRDRSMLRLAGTRYLRVTVKLSVLLTQPRIWGTPSTGALPTIDPRPIPERRSSRWRWSMAYSPATFLHRVQYSSISNLSSPILFSQIFLEQLYKDEI